MNSIARARRRPRVTSYNFRSFFWLVQRQALWHVVAFRADSFYQLRGRQEFCRRSAATLVRRANQLLALMPEWRFKP